jgi:hypothetical protein
MSDIILQASTSNVTVTSTPANITVTEQGGATFNVTTTQNTVSVSSSPVNVTVSATALISNAAVRTKLSVANISGFGNLSYDNSLTSNGVFQYTGVSTSEIRGTLSATDPVVYNSGTGQLSLNNTTLLNGQTTDNLTEGTSNLYFENFRARGVIGNIAPIQYNVLTGIISLDTDAVFSNTLANAWFTSQTTDNLAEGSTNLYLNGAGTTDDLTEGSTNLYYTNARVQAYIDAGLPALTVNGNTDVVGNLNVTGGTYIQDLNADNIDANGNITFSSGYHIIGPHGKINFNQEGVHNTPTVSITADEDITLYFANNTIFPGYGGNINFQSGYPGTTAYYPGNVTTHAFLNSGGYVFKDDLDSELISLIGDGYPDTTYRLTHDANVINRFRGQTVIGQNNGTGADLDLYGANNTVRGNNTGGESDLFIGSDKDVEISINSANKTTRERYFRLTSKGFHPSVDTDYIPLEIENTGNVTFDINPNDYFSNQSFKIVNDRTAGSDKIFHVTAEGGSSAGGNPSFITVPGTVKMLNDRLVIRHYNEFDSAVNTTNGKEVLAGNIILTESASSPRHKIVVNSSDGPRIVSKDIITLHANSDNDGGYVLIQNGRTGTHIGYFGPTSISLYKNTNLQNQNINNVNTLTAVKVVTDTLEPKTSGNIEVTGNLNVQGNLNYVNVEDLLVNDQSITLNYGNASARDAFIYVDRSGSALNNAHIKWNETSDQWEIYDGTSTYKIPTSTDDLAEGATNLYFTYDNANTWLATKTTDDLTEGTTNKYYSSTLFNTDFAGKTTDDLTEGVANLYFTTARTNSAIDAYIVGGTGIDYASGTIDLADTAVAPNTYGTGTVVPQITVDQQGRITSVTNVSITAGSGTVTSVDSGAGLTGGPITSSGTLAVGAGYGITVSADAVEVTNSEIQAQANVAFGNNTTDNLTEGTTNLYFANSLVDNWLTSKTTDDLTEGTANLYYTTDRANSAIGAYQGDINTAGNITADIITATGEFLGDLDGAISVGVFNNTASTLTKGQAVYITGAQGDEACVALANNQVAAQMPAMGIIKENISAGASGQAVTNGTMNFTGHGFTVGADLYVNGAGLLTETIPTGEGELLQKIAKALAPNFILVQGAGRTNATPNLNDGNIFVGNGSNQAVSADLSNFTYEISSNANISTSANVEGNYVIGDTLVSDYPNTPGYTQTLPLGGLFPGSFFGGGADDILVDVYPNTYNQIGSIFQLEFENTTGTGSANINGVTFYSDGTDVSGGDENLIYLYTDASATTKANAQTLGFDGNWMNWPSGGNVLTSYQSVGSTQWQIEGDGGGQLLFKNQGFTNVTLSTSGDITNTGYLKTDDIRVGSGEFVFGGVDGAIDAQLLTLYKNETNPTFTDPAISIIGGGAQFAVENDATPNLNQENGLVLKQGSAQANSLYSTPRYASYKYGGGTDFANLSYTVSSDGDWTLSIDSKAHREVYDVTGNVVTPVGGVGLDGGRLHSVAAIVAKTANTSANVTATIPVSGSTYRMAPIANGIIAFKTQQFDVANSTTVKNGTAFPYNESLDYPESTAVFIDDTLNIGSDEGTYYRFPPTPGTNGQVLQLDSANVLQWTTTVTSVDSGDGLTGGPITGSGTLAVGAGYGITVTADAVEVTNSEIQAQANIAIGDNANIFLTDQDTTLTGSLTTANVTLAQFQETVVTTANVSGATSFDVSTGSIFKANVTGDITSLALSNAVAGTSATIILTQGATTGTLTAGASWLWAGGAKTLSTTTGDVDLISVVYDGTNYYASLTTGYVT